MNRVIKFRVWNKQKKIFNLKEGAFFIRSDGVLELQKAGLGGTDYNDEMCYSSTNYPVQSDKFVVQRFTGLKDITGQDIYEGDIVIALSSNNKYKSVIEWVEAEGRWGFKSLIDLNMHFHYNLTYSCSKWKVVGNIFENPELLK